MKDYKKPSMQIIDIEQTNILCSSVTDKTCNSYCKYWHICQDRSKGGWKQCNDKVYKDY